MPAAQRIDRDLVTGGAYAARGLLLKAADPGSLLGSANGVARVQLLSSLQSTIGNAEVQRLVRATLYQRPTQVPAVQRCGGTVHAGCACAAEADQRGSVQRQTPERATSTESRVQYGDQASVRGSAQYVMPVFAQRVVSTVDLLDAKQIADARRFYTAQPWLYTKSIITKLRTALGLDPTGGVDDDLVRAVARFQTDEGTDEPGLKVDGKAGPRTLPRIFRQGLNVKATGKAMGEQAQTEVIDEWQTLGTAKARRDKLVALLNERLSAAKVPEVKPAFDKNPVNSGSFDFETWSMQIGERFLSAPALSKEQAKDALDTIWHEGRHAEQWFRMAQLRAGQGLSARGIAAELTIPATIATEAKKLPLAPGSMEAVIAQGWWESVYGSGSGHREAVLTEVECADVALEIAKKKAKDHPSPANQAALERAEKRFDKAFAAYQDLPEENDAFATGPSAAEGITKGSPGTPGLILRPAGKACGQNVPAEEPPKVAPITPIPGGVPADQILPGG